MAADSDHDSLFGDAGDLDSLFGGDDDFPSLFMEDAELSAAVGLDLSMPMLPSLPTPSPSQSLSSEAPSKPESVLLPMPAVSQEPGRVCGLALPVVIPDPLSALLCAPDGHTSGSTVVSTQNMIISGSAALPSPPASKEGDAEEEGEDEECDELDAMVEWEMLKNQAVNAHAGITSSQGDQEGLGIPLAQAFPDFRWCGRPGYRGIRIPRRIDLEEGHLEAIVPYISFRANAKLDDLYRRLELDAQEGKKLHKDIKEYLETTSRAIEVPLSLGAPEIRRRLVKAAFNLLKTLAWGDKWFSRRSASSTAKTRTKIWPRDSTEILHHFAHLLHRAVRVRKQCYNNVSRKARYDAWDVLIYGNGPRSPPIAGSTRSLGASPTPLPAPSPPVPLEALVRNVDSIKKLKRKRDAMESTVNNDENNNSNNNNNNNNGADATKFVLQVPTDAQLTYQVFVKDKQDGSDLAPRATYRHTDDVIARGAFEYLKSSFEAARYEPAIWVLTPFGSRCVTSAAEWDQAILGVYNWRRSGGDVEVDVLV